MLQLATPPAAGYAGAITGLYEDVLQGWALHVEQPDTRVALEVHIDGVFVALARADQPQIQPAQGDGFHGFAIQLKRSWLEDAGHIAVRVANQGPWLDGTLELPARQAPSEPPIASSQVWYPGGLRVTGWVWDPDAPGRAVEVIAYENGQLLARARANAPHSLLASREDANHGYSLDLPWSIADGRTHVIELRDDNGRSLAGSPITVCTLPEGMQALLRQYGQDGAADEAKLALLLRLAREQERLAPPTIGFEHYHEWHQVHQQPTPLYRHSVAADLKAGILLHGPGTDTDESRSHASIAAQRIPAQAIERAEPGALPQAVHALLSQGVDVIVPLHVGDRLAPHALDTLLPLLAGDSDAARRSGARIEPTRGAAPEETGSAEPPAWVYADNDCDDAHGRRTAPWLKPAWDIDLFLGLDLVTPGAAWSAGIVRAALSLDNLPPGGGIDDLAAAIALATMRRRALVAHVPRVLYHRRASAPTNPAQGSANPDRQAAMQWLATNLAPGATVQPNGLYPALLRVDWPLPAPAHLPRVSLIVPTRDQYKLLHACVEGLLGGTDYPDLELIVVDNDSTCPQTLAYLAELRERGVVVVPYPYPFNYAALNNTAVQHASGEIVGLVNNDVEVIEPGWLKIMVAQLLQPGVGVTGAKLLWRNGMVQHGGVVVGINGLAAHVGNHWGDLDPGYLGTNHLTRRHAAVTAACLLVRKADYEQADGLDPVRFAVSFNDVDFCLRLGRDRCVTWVASARLIHAESASRGKSHTPEKRALQAREQAFLTETIARTPPFPAYHPLCNHDWASGPYAALRAAPAIPIP